MAWTLVRRAHLLFAKQESHEKRRLLNFVLSNCTWKDGKLDATYCQPFDMLVIAASNANAEKAAGVASDGLSEIWLPGPDSNQRHGG